MMMEGLITIFSAGDFEMYDYLLMASILFALLGPWALYCFLVHGMWNKGHKGAIAFYSGGMLLYTGMWSGGTAQTPSYILTIVLVVAWLFYRSYTLHSLRGEAKIYCEIRVLSIGAGWGALVLILLLNQSGSTHFLLEQMIIINFLTVFITYMLAFGYCYNLKTISFEKNSAKNMEERKI